MYNLEYKYFLYFKLYDLEYNGYILDFII